MAETKNEVVEQKEHKLTFSEKLTNNLLEVKDGLPKDFNTTRFVNNALALLNENEQLGKFAQQFGTNQITQGLMKSAFLGLDAINKECYLIPYGNKMNFQIDYRGSKKLAKKYSLRAIKDIYAKLVLQGDEFKTWADDKGQHFEFNPLPFNGGSIVGAFAVCMFVDGGLLVDTMSLADLENTRKQSKAPNSPAWKNFTGEMYKKTVLHRLCKQIEIDFENPKQRELFDEDMAINTQEETPPVVDALADEDIIDTEYTESEVVE